MGVSDAAALRDWDRRLLEEAEDWWNEALADEDEDEDETEEGEGAEADAD